LLIFIYFIININKKEASPHCADCFAIALYMVTFLVIPDSSGELSYIIKERAVPLSFTYIP